MSNNTSNPNLIDLTSSTTSEIIIVVILLLLFLGTLRTLIAYTGYTRGTRFESWFYDKTHEELALRSAESAFEKLNISPDTKSSLKLVNTQIIRNLNALNDSKNLEKLIVLLANNSHSCESIYGTDSPVKTSVIINTMEGSLDNSSNELMAGLFVNLYTKAILSSGHVDFVIVPKAGNPLVAKELANRFKAICLICKSEKDSSRVITSSGKSQVGLSLNVEGFSYLKNKADISEAPLNGIIVDCNCSGGGGLLRTATEFNSLVQSTGLNVNPVKDGMVLFRADQDLSTQEFDTKFSEADNPINLRRFIDLDEDIKRRLLSLRELIERHNGEIHKAQVNKEIESIIQYIREKNLLVTKL